MTNGTLVDKKSFEKPTLVEGGAVGGVQLGESRGQSKVDASLALPHPPSCLRTTS